MVICGVPTLDQRSCRVDINTTLGEPLCWTVHFDQDVSGWTFTPGLTSRSGERAETDPPSQLPSLDMSDAANGNVTMCITGAQTEEEPLGLGSWTWWLAAVIPPEVELSYLVGGTLTIYPVWSFSPSCPGNVGPINVTDMIVNVETVVPGQGGSATVVPVGTLTGEWQWNTNAGATPGGAQVTTDSGDGAAATWVRFSDVDKSNFDLSAVLLLLQTGDRILAQQKMNAANRTVFEVTGAAVDGGSYVEVPVSVIAQTGDGSAAWQDLVIALPLGL